jgi:tRNA dimethylallyltransferase
MLAHGLIDETQRLVVQYGADLPLLQTLNYKQALALIDGRLTKAETLDEMRRANLRYARRQMSWWRGRTDIRWFSPQARRDLNDFLTQQL